MGARQLEQVQSLSGRLRLENAARKRAIAAEVMLVPIETVYKGRYPRYPSLLIDLFFKLQRFPEKNVHDVEWLRVSRQYVGQCFRQHHQAYMVRFCPERRTCELTDLPLHSAPFFLFRENERSLLSNIATLCVSSSPEP